MIPISIDISDILLAYSNVGSEELGGAILDSMVEAYMFEWENQVNKNLKSTRQQYKAAMDVEFVSGSNTAIISLRPTESGLPMMLEEGASQFDIKDGMAKSDKRVIKDGGGWYITIPFRFATTEALGESNIFSGKLPAPIYEKAKNLATGDRLSITDLPDGYNKLLSNKQTGVEHKSPIYAGLMRQDVSSTEKENRGGYISFRRISDKSDEGSWQHPGFAPMRLMNAALQEASLDVVAGNAIDEFLKSI